MQQSFSKYSFEKQDVVLNVVKLLADRHKSLVSQNARHEEFVFVDAHGGLGLWKNNRGERCLGSPVIIYRQLERDNVQYRGFVFEKNELRHKKLVDHLSFSQFPIECFNQPNSDAPSIIATEYGNSSNITTYEADGSVTTKELGGLIYYDNDGHGHASEIEALTTNNRLDILIHAMSPKREMYRVSNQRRIAQPQDVDSILFSMDKCLPQYIDSFHRPYWYIGNSKMYRNNSNHFLFMFGTHTPLENHRFYGPGRDRYHRTIHDDLQPMYSNEGIRRQYMTHYSNDDMAFFDGESLSWNEEDMNRFNYQIKNTIPFSVKTGSIPVQDTESTIRVAEGHVNQPARLIEPGESNEFIF